MVKINRKVEYALMVLKHMMSNPEDELTTAREICEKYNTPFDTTAKVMQIMATHEILSSLKGVKGGYSLSKDLSLVNFFELTEAIEGKSFTMDCITSNCELYGVCNITFPIKRLNEHLANFFKNLSIRELLEGEISTKIGNIETAKELVHE